MKFWKRKYEWSPREDWALPDGEEMMQAQLDTCLDSQVEAVTAALEPLLHPRTCVQAGGAFGLYPLALAQHFHRVITFEPLLANLQCMAANIAGCPNITVEEYPLWHTSNINMAMRYSKPVKNSYGAHHLTSRFGRHVQSVTTVTIDQYSLHDVDLIWLDIEGSEIHALRGAEQTIARCKPVVVLEDRELRQMAELGTSKGEAVRWMKDHWKYKVVGQAAADTIMIPE